jgi:hypothetical protein
MADREAAGSPPRIAATKAALTASPSALTSAQSACVYRAVRDRDWDQASVSPQRSCASATCSSSKPEPKSSLSSSVVAGCSLIVLSNAEGLGHLPDGELHPRSVLARRGHVTTVGPHAA